MVIVDWFYSMNAKIRIEYIEFGSLVKKTQLFCAFAGYVFLDYMSFQTIYLYRSDFFKLCLFRLYLFKLIVFKIYVFSDCVFSDFVFADNTHFGRHEHFFSNKHRAETLLPDTESSLAGVCLLTILLGGTRSNRSGKFT